MSLNQNQKLIPANSLKFRFVKMKKVIAAYLCVIFISTSIDAQEKVLLKDTLQPKELDSIYILAFSRNQKLQYLPEVQGVNIFSGKKTSYCPGYFVI